MSKRVLPERHPWGLSEERDPRRKNDNIIWLGAMAAVLAISAALPSLLNQSPAPELRPDEEVLVVEMVAPHNAANDSVAPGWSDHVSGVVRVVQCAPGVDVVRSSAEQGCSTFELRIPSDAAFDRFDEQVDVGDIIVANEVPKTS